MKKMNDKIAILICNKYHNVPTSIDNNLFLAALDQANLGYELVIWDQPDICWEKYSGVLIRATWDYIEGKRDQFIKSLEAIAQRNIPVFNSIDTIRWNSRKNYLLDLKQKNIDIINTLITTPTRMNDLTNFLNQTNHDEYVVKPIISGGAHKTFRVKSCKIQQTLKRYFKEDEEIIIQPFISEIVTEGEWSLIFFDGIYSHSVLLTPARGDFRVQIKHGGSVQSAQPSVAMMQTAKKILALIEGETPLYARIDFVRKENHPPYLMELELIEPALFFRWDPIAANRFVTALLRRLHTS